MRELHGVVVVDKPGGMTSADVVARVKRALGAGRVGHTGTLDPMATGVLPVAVGEGTKLAPFLLAEDKEYEGELLLGLTTGTLDIEGAVTARRDPAGVTEHALAAAVAAWVGPREQIPPMVSALRQGGKRLYDLARQGIEVERAPRAIVVARFALTAVELPKARFVVACSKGTYVRSLVRDVGEAVGCGATLTALRRTRVGRFTLDDALPLAGVTPEIAARKLVLPDAAVAHLLTLVVDEAGERTVKFGQPLAAPAEAGEGTVVRILTAQGALAAVAQAAGGRLSYLRVFNYGLTRVGV
jgi:tRNA pseudouridine55 synthase